MFADQRKTEHSLPWNILRITEEESVVIWTRAFLPRESESPSKNEQHIAYPVDLHSQRNPEQSKTSKYIFNTVFESSLDVQSKCFLSPLR